MTLSPKIPLATLAAVTVGALVTMWAVPCSAGQDVDSRVPSPNPQTTSDFPLGDPRRCMETAIKHGVKMMRFEVLPGYGWDNLRNVDEGQVVVFNYSQCRTTEDGRFLLPDSVSAVPVKASNVQIFAELMTHWTNWTSTTARSVNVEAGLSLSKFSISGKFSSDFEQTKSKQIGDKSVTTRTQLRYIRYGVQLQPDTPLHPVFKDRVLGIAAAQELGEKDQARYLAQLLVRDFGTHVVTKADAGAALEKEDNLKQDWVMSQSDKKSAILASASASLFGVFHMSASYGVKTDDAMTQSYNQHRTSSRILTKGGPLFRPANFTPDTWAAEVDSDLVALDRSGDPIFYVLTGATLPELPTSTLNEVYERVKEAVEVYYSFNTLPGCLDPTSPNFSPAANTDDGSCHPPPTNLTFGGVFQTCSMSPGSNNGNLCGGLTQVNPQTGTYSCPAKYRAIQLHSGTTASSRTQHVCHRHWLFWRKCHDDYYRSQATYTTYWCVATDGGVPARSGYLFGGLYTSQVANPVTRAFSCPPTFFPLNIGMKGDLHVCISDDYEFGEVYALPFAGFISCQAGNPLAVSDNGAGGSGGQGRGRKKRDVGEEEETYVSLKMFFKDQADEWPQRCPDGFSRHLATVDQGCAINYCVLTGSMAGPVLPPVKRPPFMDAPPLAAPSSDNLVVFDPSGPTWKRNDEAEKMLETQTSRTPSPSDDTVSLSPGAAAGISVGATLGCVVLATLAVLAVRAKRRRGRAGYRRLENPLLDPQGDYGSVRPRPASAPTSSSSSTAVNVSEEAR
ncbi:macrophage-expressed gene 1 protein-like [Babylonia areolata]|uniref:macrophage-expressed gene 1 protein-like n=1 Tax=Babylonia areolata TaxID=304850 RepID=UPI003FCF0B2C